MNKKGYEPIPDFYIKVPLCIKTLKRGWMFDVLVSKTESTIASLSSRLSDKDSKIKRLIVFNHTINERLKICVQIIRPDLTRYI